MAELTCSGNTWMISNAARKNAGAGLPTISAFTSQANCKI